MAAALVTVVAHENCMNCTILPNIDFCYFFYASLIIKGAISLFFYMRYLSGLWCEVKDRFHLSQ